MRFSIMQPYLVAYLRRGGLPTRFCHAAFAVPGSLCKFTHVDAKTRGQTRVSTGYARTSIKKGTHLADACPQKEDIEYTLALVQVPYALNAIPVCTRTRLAP